MYQVLTCIRDEHDLRLVLVAALICVVACFSAIGLFERARHAQKPAGLVALAATLFGAGVWATHFVAVLAFDPGAPMAFDRVGTVLSMGIAVVGAGLGFAIALGGRLRRALGGGVVGFAISAMHFTGITALHMQARVEWLAAYVAAAILLSVLLSAAALVVQAEGRRAVRQRGAAALLTLAIVSLHFTAMTALNVLPDPTIAFAPDTFSRPVLAIGVTVVVLSLLAAPYVLLRLEQVTQRRTLSMVTRSLDAMPAGMAFFDDRDTLISWNEAYAQMSREIGVEPRVGVPREAMMQAAMRAGWGPPDGALDPGLIERMRAWKGEFSIDSLGPEGRWLRHKQFPLPQGGGAVTLTDITAEKEFLDALTAAKEHAEIASAAKTAFLANMSHEIRTPLNGVLGVAELLGRRPLDPEARDLVEMLQASGRLLNGLLSDLLDLSRLGAGAVGLRLEPTDVAVIAADTQRLFAGSAKLKGLALEVSVSDAAAGWVLCDQVRLLQVLGNLINNAVKFTDAGHVALTVERVDEKLIFCVSDTGIGFGAAEKARLFERFAQADGSATRAHGGAGLGLSIAGELVNLMGGELDCVSTPGEGSTFVVTLPLPAIPAPEAAVIARAAFDPASVEGRVLVVDDNETNRRIIATMLGAVGLDHAEACDGHEAIETLSREPFSAVLMDLQMPVMDGLEATRRIRDREASEGRARTPIFVVSANCLDEHVAASLAAGADDHLAKPVSISELLAALAPHVETVEKVA